MAVCSSQPIEDFEMNWISDKLKSPPRGKPLLNRPELMAFYIRRRQWALGIAKELKGVCNVDVARLANPDDEYPFDEISLRMP